MQEIFLTAFVPAFVTFFVVVDPVGIAPVFAALTEGSTAAQRRFMALKGTLIAALVLAFFALVGKPFLNALGITLDALRVAGGFMLFMIGYEMVFEKRTKRREESAEHIQEEAVAHDEDDISVFPIAVPMLAGPGAIAAVMLQMSQNADSSVGQGMVALAMAVVLVLTFLIFLAAARVTAFMGPTFSQVFSRVLGLVVASFAVQYMLDGLYGTFFKG
ncbi:multiple antibiotic resistance protein [Rhodothalassium salexigens DSM 2132]|uniref:UPF0056 membrane protein n=1 Tax=Rhodothalassium salexigens DSM 2132 TaxID=1188247 RepID=A0A4R2PLA7_RHOSA|nr:MarC family protein [Rhodothalassium salexigens]MBB4211117.1 multiple antibiotic resistance protein [Rhodothalassium salexigens DSM 2132]MBK1637458.1 MarC family transcriptional regulator [Rhodothalassium salexigens DSM 2132]TCP36227.1 multiple antibiotic resistance protein [Rhodothalassium salexigens DSM 2132]